MPLTFRFVDPVTPANVRLDLNSSTGFGLVHTPNLGTVGLETDWLGHSVSPGSVQVGPKRNYVEMVIPVFLNTQANWAAVKTKWDTLATELDRVTNCIEFIPTGGTAYYIDTYRSPIPSLFRGQQKPNPSIYLHDTEPVELIIYRHPLMRGAGTYI